MSERPTTASNPDDPLWYKDAVVYEVHVRAFYDSNGDGVGDFAGLTEKLDYLQDLGVTAVWLLPFYPSPLMDDGYDIADYSSVHPAYGDLADVRNFIREAHRRGLKVITELVCNHTSDQHPWFQRARRAKPGTSARDFYVWSDTPEKYRDARIIFKDFEPSNWSWDAVAGAYYWHRFYSHQPDLNYDNPGVKKAITRVMDSWLRMGVDGLRLDAVPYLFEREGTNCENLPETYEFLEELRSHVDQRFSNRMLLAEANQWPEDAVSYFGDGDMCQMCFHFPLMPRLFMSIHMEDRFPIIDILRQTPPIPDSCQWAIFLRNHDELTLEMVTDEERDYMYRVYAVEPQMRINLGIRRRLAPLLGNHRRRIELMNGLLFSLPGTPFIYYGDEIGMGDNVYLGDRNGVRTPMQWSADRNAGFSRANPQRLYLPIIIDPEYHFETVNVESQRANPHSLFWWTKRLIALRKRYRAFGRGALEFLHPENRKVLAFVRSYEDERILVVANLSRFVQGVELDLSACRGLVPVEMFGRIEFPPVGDQPYFITLGPHSFYWFSLEPARVPALPLATLPPDEVPVLVLPNGWESAFLRPDSSGSPLQAALPSFLSRQRWFAGNARRIRAVEIVESVPMRDGIQARETIVEVQYTEGNPETYFLPLAFATGDKAARVREHFPAAAVARLAAENGGEGLVYDAAVEPAFGEALLRQIAATRRLRGGRGDAVGERTRFFRQLAEGTVGQLPISLLRGEQTNTSIVFGDKLILKLFRRLEEGVNPELELGRYLTARGFTNTPRVAGAIQYVRARREPMTLAILQEYVVNEGDGWSYALDALRDFFDRTLAIDSLPEVERLSARTLLEHAEEEPPELARETIGAFLESARLLGKRTAEMHSFLATAAGEPALAPEPFSFFYQRSLYQSLRNLANDCFGLLERRLREREEETPAEAGQVLQRQEAVLERFRSILGRRITGLRIRQHGDYHLGQVLYKGNDFVITDLEGEPARPLSERRLKRSPLRDVAGMLRSFNYAVHTALREVRASGLPEAKTHSLESWGRLWNLWVSATFLKAYLEVAEPAGFTPQSRDDLVVLLDVFLLEKAVYEIGYEIRHRPDWLVIPLQGILELLES